MGKTKSVVKGTPAGDGQDDDEPLVYWRKWTSTTEDSAIADIAALAVAEVSSISSPQRRASRKRPDESRGRRTHRQGPLPESPPLRTSARCSPFDVPKRGHETATQQPPRLPSLDIPQTDALLSWVASPMSPHTMTMPFNRRTIGPIDEDGALTILRVPEIVVTPPSPVLGMKGEDEPVVARHLIFEAEVEEQRDMLRQEWVEYVWGGWLGRGEAFSEYVGKGNEHFWQFH